MTVVETDPTPYTLISSDCHAGASHDTYRTYLEERYLDDFDAWRGKYKNPFRDLQGTTSATATGTTSGASRSSRPTASSAR